MNVHLVLDRFDPARGGAERSLREVLGALVRRGHRARVYCMSGEETDGIELRQVRVPERHRASREREFATRAVAMARAEDGIVYAVRHVLEADLYHPHGGTWAASQAARRTLARWPSLAGLWQRHSAKHRYFAYADREIFRRRRKLLTVAVSHAVRDDILERYGEFEPEVEVVWPAVDLTRFRPGEPARKATRPRLLFVAHEHRLKGLDELLDAFVLTELFRRGAVLSVVGRNPPSRYRRKVERLRAASQVELLGESGDLSSLYREADLLVHPTHHDPCALVTLEALASGLAVVTTEANGAKDLIPEGAGVVLPSPPPVPLLAGALDELWARRREASAAAPGVRPLLKLEDSVDRLELLLERAERRR